MRTFPVHGLIATACAAIALAACSAEQGGDAPSATDAATTSNAPPSEAAYRGAGLARQVCAQCHHVTGGPAPDGMTAESFIAIANRDDTTLASLEAWLTSEHPTMPDFIFNEETVVDLSAYIMGLKGRT